MLIGLVGKPSSGKSTFFKAMTLAEIDIAPYPFTTIRPNSGIGHVRIDDPAREFGKVSNPRTGFITGTQRFAAIELLDVAGLVPGAHEGKGMGNQFLDDLRQADALIHIVDASGSTDSQGRAVEPGQHDPAHDIIFLETELDMWYLSIFKRSWEKFAKQTYMERHKIEDAITTQFSGLGATPGMVKSIIIKENLDSENPMKWSDENLMTFAVELRKATKPILIAANKADMPSAAENVKRLKKSFPDIIIPCSAESELALKEAGKENLIEYVPGDSGFKVKDESRLTLQQKNALNFIKENVLEKFGSTGVQGCLNSTVFKLLKYITVFPCTGGKLEDNHGNVLPDCLFLPPGTTALSLAYQLHTDFGEGFIRAMDLRTKKAVGKEHVLQNRDIIEIISKN